MKTLAPKHNEMKQKFTVMGIASAFCCLPFLSSCDNSDDGDKYYQVTALSSDTLMGDVVGSGKYRLGDVVKLLVTPRPGFEFDHWDDGSVDNPKMVDVVNVANFTAYFRVKNEGVVAQHLSGAVMEDLTLKDLGLKIDYIIDTALVVGNASLLKVAPGVTIEFSGKKACIIVEDGAALQMSGKEAAPIILQGPVDESGKGSWGYVEYRSGRLENEVSYVKFSNGGCEKDSAVLRLNGNASLSIENCTMAGGLGMGISASGANGNPFKSFAGNRISDMANYAMHISIDHVNSLGDGNQFPGGGNFILVSGDRIESGAVTFNKQSIPYLLDDDLTVGEDGVLALEAGGSLAFKQDKKLTVLPNGVFQVNGTSSSLASLKGMQDGASGYWKGVDFQSNSEEYGGNYMNYCVVNGGGSEEGGACLSLSDDAKLALNGAQFFNSGSYGMSVRIDPSTAKVEGLEAGNIKFANNKAGNIYDRTTLQVLEEMP